MGVFPTSWLPLMVYGAICDTSWLPLMVYFRILKPSHIINISTDRYSNPHPNYVFVSDLYPIRYPIPLGSDSLPPLPAGCIHGMRGQSISPSARDLRRRSWFAWATFCSSWFARTFRSRTRTHAVGRVRSVRQESERRSWYGAPADQHTSSGRTQLSTSPEPP